MSRCVIPNKQYKYYQDNKIYITLNKLTENEQEYVLY